MKTRAVILSLSLVEFNKMPLGKILLTSLALLTLSVGLATTSHAQTVSVPRADAVRFLRQEYQVYTPCKQAALPAIDAWGPSGDRDAVLGVLTAAELSCGSTCCSPVPDDLQHNATANLLDYEVWQYLFYMNQPI